MPRLAGEVSKAFSTPLPTVLGWGVDEIIFWHEEACAIAGLS
jgi:hypothetical protein